LQLRFQPGSHLGKLVMRVGVLLLCGLSLFLKLCLQVIQPGLPGLLLSQNLGLWNQHPARQQRPTVIPPGPASTEDASQDTDTHIKPHVRTLAVSEPARLHRHSPTLSGSAHSSANGPVTIADRTGSDYRTGGKGLLGESRQSRCENNSNAPNFTPKNVKKMKALRVNAQIELLVP